MKQQVVVIHGADSFLQYEEYLDSLKEKALWNKIEDFDKKGWKGNLQQSLGDGYQVIAPKMPNGKNARYLEWKIWIDGFFDQIESNAIFIGHSMGAIFLAKYLTEKGGVYNAVLLVAAPFEDSVGESLCDFNFDTKDFAKDLHAKKVILYHSTDDPVVPYSHSQMYLDLIQNAKLVTLEERGHINQETFPEIVNDILLLQN